MASGAHHAYRVNGFPHVIAMSGVRREAQRAQTKKALRESRCRGTADSGREFRGGREFP